MIDISKAFAPISEPISGFFQQPGVAYYIPLYQREYSWEAGNVEQLMEDIFNGVKSLVEDSTARDRAIHFMGTVILFQESSPRQNIQPRDDRALPPRIDNVIDGQQRISTIAVLAAVLLQRLLILRAKLPADIEFDSLRTEVDSKRDLLLEMFSVDIKRGSPNRKPVIVRGSIDGWTFDGADADNYRSGVTSYLAAVIRSVSNNSITSVEKPLDKRVARNFLEMQKWLNRVEETSANEGDYPRAKQILQTVDEESFWSYPRPEFHQYVPDATAAFNAKSEVVSALVQLLTFIHYFTERCCFTVIKPVSEEWAFDMFQSLNASGTPLTAIETFKPLVVNQLAQENKNFKDTDSSKYFSKVDKLISENGPTSKKNKLTDEFLTTFALVYDGYPLSKQFSLQRRYLNERLKTANGAEGREELVRQMADLANYWECVIGFEPNNQLAIEGLESLGGNYKEESGFNVLFVRDSGHKMAHSILSRFYSRLIRLGSKDAAVEFVDACKAVGAFYFLWRSAKSNSGLDDVYRKLLRTGDAKIGVEPMSATNAFDVLDVKKLQEFLANALGEFNVKDTWLKQAAMSLRYDSAKPMCKFALLLSAHDAIPDTDFPGLMKPGVNGTRKLIDPTIWSSPNFKSIEHIAPVKGDKYWDHQLYENNRFNTVGNLTLLPVEINSSLGKQEWRVKSLYYRHLAEKDPSKLDALMQEAKASGIELQPHTVDLLTNSSYAHHIEPIVGMVGRQEWNADLVELRTKRICELAWLRVAPWLGLKP